MAQSVERYILYRCKIEQNPFLSPGIISEKNQIFKINRSRSPELIPPDLNAL